MEFFRITTDRQAAEPVQCPLCGTATRNGEYRYTIEGRASTIYRCVPCDFLFSRPILLSELSQRQMDTVEDAELFNAGLLRTLHEKLIIGREIRTVRNILGNGRHTLLDIGCGTGWTTAIWAANGFDVTGLEPSAVRRQVAREKYGLRVLPNYLEELDSSQTFDVIVLRHVLEHLEDPLAMAEKIRRLLSDNGLFVLIVPNINCLGRYLFDTKWPWILPFHCNFFTPRALRVLAPAAGLEVCSLYQTPSPLWYPKSFAKLLPDHGASLTRRIYDRLNVLSMVPFAPLVGLGYLLGLSDNLTLVARTQKR